MSLIPKDMTPVLQATALRGAGAMRWQRPAYLNLLPPCNEACPAGENIQAWLALAQAGEYRQAWLRYMEENPLPSTHGRACYHPCEGMCNRAHLDAPVAIHAIDRFLGDLASRAGWTVPAGAASGKRVLVIGAGPAGLSCAYHLRRMGHAVEIRDAMPQPGGMLHYGIPAYRLPRADLMQEIRRIEAMGVKIVCNHRLGDLLAEKAGGGFDAVFVGVGASVGNHVDLPAMDAGRMLDAITLLENVEQGRAPRLGRVVAVYGGGNTAMDAARIAKRLGAEEAVLVYRRDRAHMPAHPYEADEAFAEGVRVKWLSTVRHFGDHGITIERMQLTLDGKGVIGTGELELIRADSLVLALGQHADLGFLSAVPDLQVLRGEVLAVDDALRTGHAGVYAGGDVIGGARTMTAAVGHGKKAARAIDAWLRGRALPERHKPPVVGFQMLNLPVYLDADRREERALPLSERNGFDEVMQGLDEHEARYEAQRCLSCGNCFECDNCYAACPEQAIVKLGKGRLYRIDYELCTGCATCYEQCPSHAMQMVPEPQAGEPAPGLLHEPTMPAQFRTRP